MLVISTSMGHDCKFWCPRNRSLPKSNQVSNCLSQLKSLFHFLHLDRMLHWNISCASLRSSFRFASESADLRFGWGADPAWPLRGVAVPTNTVGITPCVAPTRNPNWQCTAYTDDLPHKPVKRMAISHSHPHTSTPHQSTHAPEQHKHTLAKPQHHVYHS